MILTEKRERNGMAIKPPRSNGSDNASGSGRGDNPSGSVRHDGPSRSNRSDSRAERRRDNGGDMWSGHDVFTTGEAAEICNVSQQTIIRCFDSGRLGGFRVPGSRFRRIPRAELVRFMKDNGIPLTSLDGEGRRVLLVSSDTDIVESLTRAVSADDRLILRVATSAFDGGVLTAQFAPHLIVLDVDAPHLDPCDVLQHVRPATPETNAGDTTGAHVVVIGARLPGESVERLTELGAAACLRKPVDASGLVRQISAMV